MGDASRIRVTEPLEPYVSGFVAALVGRGYTPVSTAHQLRLMAHVSRWLASERFGPGDLSLARVEELLALLEDLRESVPEFRRAAVDAELGLVKDAAERAFSDQDDRLAAMTRDRQGLGATDAVTRIPGPEPTDL